MKKATGIEKSIIESFEDIEEISMDCLAFGNCILAINTKQFKAGTAVNQVAFNFEECTYEIWCDTWDKPTESGELTLSLVK